MTERTIGKYGGVTIVTKEARADSAMDVDALLISSVRAKAEGEGLTYWPGRDRVQWVDPDDDPMTRVLDPDLPPDVLIARISIGVIEARGLA